MGSRGLSKDCLLNGYFRFNLTVGNDSIVKRLSTTRVAILKLEGARPECVLIAHP